MPATQGSQAVAEVLPVLYTAMAFPASQGVQAAVEGETLYDPGLHAEHVSMLFCTLPSKPAEHAHGPSPPHLKPGKDGKTNNPPMEVELAGMDTCLRYPPVKTFTSEGTFPRKITEERAVHPLNALPPIEVMEDGIIIEASQLPVRSSTRTNRRQSK